MIRKIINIQSVSDIITNSSTEVFVMNSNTDSFKELMGQFMNPVGQYMEVFPTENDVKQYLIEHFWDCYDSLEIFDDFIDVNPIKLLASELYFDKEKFVKTINIETLVNALFPAYQDLVGKAILTFEDDCYYPDAIDMFIKGAKDAKIIEYSGRY